LTARRINCVGKIGAWKSRWPAQINKSAVAFNCRQLCQTFFASRREDYAQSKPTIPNTYHVSVTNIGFSGNKPVNNPRLDLRTMRNQMPLCNSTPMPLWRIIEPGCILADISTMTRTLRPNPLPLRRGDVRRRGVEA
jgi:hypothetical protein